MTTRSTQGTYVKKAGNTIRLGNRHVELGFDLKSNGALVSLRDRRSNTEFIRDSTAPRILYRLSLYDQKRKTATIDSRQARKSRWSVTDAADGRTLVLESSSFPGHGISVRVEVSLQADSQLSTWHFHVSGLRPHQSLYLVECPIISGVLKVGDGVPGEVLATPRQGAGYLFRNPYPVVDGLPLMSGKGPDQPATGIGQFSQSYPGNQSMQFMLYYHSRAGLYLACHDAGMHVKRFVCGYVPEFGPSPALVIGHDQPDLPGRNVDITYDTVLGVFHGDWYDGADIYKRWARQQWWCRRKLAERDTAEWVRKGFGVWQMSNFHIPKVKLNHSLNQIANEVNGIAKDTGVPLAALIFNFEKGGAWTGPKGFPPKEGIPAFRKAMQKLRKAGNHGFVYMPGGQWYVAIDSYNPPFDSRKAFRKEGFPNAIVGADGKKHLWSWYGGWHVSRMCPSTQHVQELTDDLLLSSLKWGATAVQIDNFPIGTPEACFSTKHGHTPGHGPWYADAWRRVLETTRRKAKALNPECVITTEGIAETYIPYVDLFDQRAGNMEYFGHWHEADPMHGEPIPLFNYVYSGYIGAYLAAYPECNRPEVLYWTRSLGKALTQGCVPSSGRYFPVPKQSNPVTLAFYKKVVRSAVRDCWKYIMFGEMLHAPAIVVPRMEASYVRFTGEDLDHLLPHNRHVVTDDAVQHSAWRAADDTLAWIFVNISRKPVRFDVVLSDPSNSSTPRRITISRDSKRSVVTESARLPRKTRVSMAPLSVVVLEAHTR